MIEMTVNGRAVQVDVPGDTPLLWVIREHVQLTGSKFGCGMGLCGACTMHLNGNAVRTCILPVSAAAGAQITTIEGIGKPEQLHPVQQAWLEHSVAQCGYCQSGQIMSAVDLLAKNPKPSDADIESAMSGNICRCGTYPRIKAAVHRAAELQSQSASFYDASEVKPA